MHEDCQKRVSKLDGGVYEWLYTSGTLKSARGAFPAILSEISKITKILGKGIKKWFGKTPKMLEI